MNAQTRLHMSPPACGPEGGVAAGVEKVLATTPRRLLSDSPPGEASVGDCANGDTTAAALASVRNTAETRLVGGEVTSAGASVRVSGSTPARSGLASFFFLRFAGGDASSALLADARRSRLDARVARGERARFFETLGGARGSSGSALAVGATSGFARDRASAPFLNATSASLLVLNVPRVLQVRVAGLYARTLYDLRPLGSSRGRMYDAGIAIFSRLGLPRAMVLTPRRAVSEGNDVRPPKRKRQTPKTISESLLT
jgi:hypothetical protein